MAQARVRVLRIRRPRYVVCPNCGNRQPFKQHSVYTKLVKDLHADHPVLIQVPRIYVRCRNPVCPKRLWLLPIPGIVRYARATERLKQEAVASLIDDNTTTRRVARRLARSLNTTASKSTVDRWKHQAASRIGFDRIIPLLGFSGFLSLDEYKPSRSDRYDLIACDAANARLLYLETCSEPIEGAGSIHRGDVEHFCCQLFDFGLQPEAVIVDMATAYPKQIWKVWPKALLQFDFFHVVQEAYRFFNQALLALRRQLRAQGRPEDAHELWEDRHLLLKRPDRLTSEEFEQQILLTEAIPDPALRAFLEAKERFHSIFGARTVSEAVARRADWMRSAYPLPPLRALQRFLGSWRFPYMITYLKHPGVPRCGNAETCIRQWRLMEKVRYGLNSRGRQEHLKLFQMRRYLGWKIA